MVPGDVRVDVEPEALNPIRVGTVGWQKVKDSPVTELGKESLRLLAAVDDEVVEDEVDPTCLRVRCEHSPDQGAEKIARFRCAFTREDATGARSHRSRQVVLPVFARSQHPPLETPRHPVQPDLWVEMDVDLVRKEDRFFVAVPPSQAPDRSEPRLAFPSGPRTTDDRLWA